MRFRVSLGILGRTLCDYGVILVVSPSRGERGPDHVFEVFDCSFGLWVVLTLCVGYWVRRGDSAIGFGFNMSVCVLGSSTGISDRGPQGVYCW